MKKTVHWESDFGLVGISSTTELITGLFFNGTNKRNITGS